MSRLKIFRSLRSVYSSGPAPKAPEERQEPVFVHRKVSGEEPKEPVITATKDPEPPFAQVEDWPEKSNSPQLQEGAELAEILEPDAPPDAVSDLPEVEEVSSKPYQDTENKEKMKVPQDAEPIEVQVRPPVSHALVPYKENALMQEQDISPLTGLAGFVGACVVDSESGMMLNSVGSPDFDLEVAAAVNSEVVKAKQRAIASLGLEENIEDILITLDTQYHLIRPLASYKALFIYLALKRSEANLAIARISLKSVEKNISVDS